MRVLAPVLGFCVAFGGLALASDVIYVPTPQDAVDEMLRLAGISRDDLVYDLGSGDGRILISAARDYGARGVGIDIDPVRIAESKANAEAAGVADKVRFIQGDLFETDLRPATAVTLYLLSSLNLRLRPKLLNELRPGTPVVSHDFDMGDWKPDQAVQVGSSRVYLWLVPADVEGEWEANIREGLEGRRLHLSIEQEFQQLTGTAMAEAARVQEVSGRIDGDRIDLTIGAIGGGEERRFSGRVDGRRMTGSALAGDGRPVASWHAVRAAPVQARHSAPAAAAP